ncbi:MAG TPA: magnesium transporter [Candidatus Nanoarchaeia archaeon]|nr:magnesium transporter [Candidatus Nanoarchaeia archaeon]
MSLFTKIIRESLPMLLAASLITSIGGLSLQFVQDSLMFFLPLFIMLPAMNAMMGDFGIVMVSKFTTYLSEHPRPALQKRRRFAHHLFRDMFVVALLSTAYMVMLSLLLSAFHDFPLTSLFVFQTFVITFLVVFTLFLIIFMIAMTFGWYAYKRKKDPDDMLIPLTTSIADLGTMIMLALLIRFFFGA